MPRLSRSSSLSTTLSSIFSIVALRFSSSTILSRSSWVRCVVFLSIPTTYAKPGRKSRKSFIFFVLDIHKLLTINNLQRGARRNPLTINDLGGPARASRWYSGTYNKPQRNRTFFLQLLGFGVIVFIVLLIINLCPRVLSDLQIGGDERSRDCSLRPTLAGSIPASIGTRLLRGSATPSGLTPVSFTKCGDLALNSLLLVEVI